MVVVGIAIYCQQQFSTLLLLDKIQHLPSSTQIKHHPNHPLPMSSPSCVWIAQNPTYTPKSIANLIASQIIAIWVRLYLLLVFGWSTWLPFLIQGTVYNFHANFYPAIQFFAEIIHRPDHPLVCLDCPKSGSCTQINHWFHCKPNNCNSNWTLLVGSWCKFIAMSQTRHYLQFPCQFLDKNK